MPKKKGREERLETFRGVHAEQEERARREAIRILTEHIREAMKDERAADTMYENYAREAEKTGFPEVAITLRGIGADERRHFLRLESMIRELVYPLSLASLSKDSSYHGGSYLRESERGRY